VLIMGLVIEFRTAQEYRLVPEERYSCEICGADLWHMNRFGKICCADCGTVCPYRLQEIGQEGRRRRQAGCTLADDDTIRDID